ncbi:MAG TPA: hypothetical protein VGC04_14415, partial [Cellulomonas sp.]
DGSTLPAELYLEFDEWLKETHVESHRDARVLPLHMFAPRRDWPDLASPGGLDAFERAHGGPSRLSDEASRLWKQPNGLHGNDVLVVANHELPMGYHWDVGAAQTVSHLSSLVERWKFERGSYANVSPDGYVRGGQSSAESARRDGVAPRPPAPTLEATPKQRRRHSRQKG